MDPGHVLVPDSLDAVSSEAVVQQSGALQRLSGGQLQVGVLLFSGTLRLPGVLPDPVVVR
ncbi:MAG: hypothetical protein U5P10_14420 [Spirochaetia bacterium]|nr:hypothetical protein [Spirochaetia bacterium]